MEEVKGDEDQRLMEAGGEWVQPLCLQLLFLNYGGYIVIRNGSKLSYLTNTWKDELERWPGG